MNYLLIRLSSLGDVVLALAVARAIKEGDSQARVGFMVKSAYQDLVRLCPDVDMVYAHGDSAFRNFGADIALDLHNVPKSWWVAIQSGAHTIVSVKKRSWARRQLVWRSRWKRWTNTVITVGETHLHAASQDSTWRVADAYQVLLTRLGIPGTVMRPRIQPDQNEAMICQKTLGGGKPILGVVPGAKWATKQWPVSHYVELINRVNTLKPVQVVVFGDEHERSLGDQLSSDTGAINQVGQLSLTQLSAWLSCCHAVVGGDTGPLHLASAVGTPVFTLYGPTHPTFGFLPTGPKDLVAMLDISCRPCGIHGGEACPIGTHACMTELKPEVLAPRLAGVL